MDSKKACLCVCVNGPSLSEAMLQLKEANRWADLIEFRLDCFAKSELEDIQKLRNATTLPVIFTYRGNYQKLLDLLVLKPDYVDLEAEFPLSVFLEIKQRFPEIKRICSHHDFEKTPEDLTKLFGKLEAIPAEIYKIATMARTSTDALRMLLLVKNCRKPVVGLCMGELGEITRILAPVVGSLWSYACVQEERAVAQGQIPIHTLIETYRYRTLSKKTMLFGLIGDPVSKSHSHRTHNAVFGKLGVDAVYVKMLVKEPEVAAFLALAPEVGFRGLSVTMPLKEKVSKGAVNTMLWKVGKWISSNTDGLGACEAIEKRVALQGKKMVILGAGGAARAIAKEALCRGAEVFIVNRTIVRGENLAKELGCTSLPDLPQDYDILVNATSVGMGNTTQSPVSEEDLLENRVVMDVISRPKMTLLLQFAQKKNCITIPGIDMFINQAVWQYDTWFSQKWKRERIKEILTEAIDG